MRKQRALQVQGEIHVHGHSASMDGDGLVDFVDDDHWRRRCWSLLKAHCVNSGLQGRFSKVQEGLFKTISHRASSALPPMRRHVVSPISNWRSAVRQ
jgi:hypothetical protein